MSKKSVIDRVIEPIKGGFIRVVETMGDDSSIVQAARVSYGKGTTKVSQDRGLIRYLMKHSHTSPFEMNEIKFHIKVPVYIWRQWIRHRTANVNEISGRYSIIMDKFYRTSPEEWRTQSTKNRQGSEGTVPSDQGRIFSEQEYELQGAAYSEYTKRLEAGVSREQARKDLPLSMFTEAYWKIDLHNLFHFLGLRMDKHAQEEMRAYANAIGEIVAEWCPLAWEAFIDYKVNIVSFSVLERTVIRNFIENNPKWSELLEYFSKRERAEFIEKARDLGMFNEEKKSIPSSLISYIK